jgi:hypothetical protein
MPNERPYTPKISLNDGDLEQVEVPSAWGMDDETFIKHLELRHRDDCKIETYMTRHNIDVWVNMYRIFHDRLHKLAVPGQYDHYHNEEKF